MNPYPYTYTYPPYTSYYPAQQQYTHTHALQEANDTKTGIGTPYYAYTINTATPPSTAITSYPIEAHTYARQQYHPQPHQYIHNDSSQSCIENRHEDMTPEVEERKVKINVKSEYTSPTQNGNIGNANQIQQQQQQQQSIGSTLMYNPVTTIGWNTYTPYNGSEANHHSNINSKTSSSSSTDVSAVNSATNSMLMSYATQQASPAIPHYTHQQMDKHQHKRSTLPYTGLFIGGTSHSNSNSNCGLNTPSQCQHQTQNSNTAAPTTVTPPSPSTNVNRNIYNAIPTLPPSSSGIPSGRHSMPPILPSAAHTHADTPATGSESHSSTMMLGIHSHPPSHPQLPVMHSYTPIPTLSHSNTMNIILPSAAILRQQSAAAVTTTGLAMYHSSSHTNNLVCLDDNANLSGTSILNRRRNGSTVEHQNQYEMTPMKSMLMTPMNMNNSNIHTPLLHTPNNKTNPIVHPSTPIMPIQMLQGTPTHTTPSYAGFPLYLMSPNHSAQQQYHTRINSMGISSHNSTPPIYSLHLLNTGSSTNSACNTPNLMYHADSPIADLELQPAVITRPTASAAASGSATSSPNRSLRGSREDSGDDSSQGSKIDINVLVNRESTKAKEKGGFKSISKHQKSSKVIAAAVKNHDGERDDPNVNQSSTDIFGTPSKASSHMRVALAVHNRTLVGNISNDVTPAKDMSSILPYPTADGNEGSSDVIKHNAYNNNLLTPPHHCKSHSHLSTLLSPTKVSLPLYLMSQGKYMDNTTRTPSNSYLSAQQQAAVVGAPSHMRTNQLPPAPFVYAANLHRSRDKENIDVGQHRQQHELQQHPSSQPSVRYVKKQKTVIAASADDEHDDSDYVDEHDNEDDDDDESEEESGRRKRKTQHKPKHQQNTAGKRARSLSNSLQSVASSSHLHPGSDVTESAPSSLQNSSSSYQSSNAMNHSHHDDDDDDVNGEGEEEGGENSTYVCNECNKSFNKLTALRRHSKCHSGLRPHLCGVCGLSFSERGNLKRHYKIHTGEKLYVCPYCSKSFARRCHLLQHQRANRRADSCSRLYQYTVHDIPQE